MAGAAQWGRGTRSRWPGGCEGAGTRGRRSAGPGAGRWRTGAGTCGRRAVGQALGRCRQGLMGVEAGWRRGGRGLEAGGVRRTARRVGWRQAAQRGRDLWQGSSRGLAGGGRRQGGAGGTQAAWLGRGAAAAGFGGRARGRGDSTGTGAQPQGWCAHAGLKLKLGRLSGRGAVPRGAGGARATAGRGCLQAVHWRVRRAVHA